MSTNNNLLKKSIVLEKFVEANSIKCVILGLRKLVAGRRVQRLHMLVVSLGLLISCFFIHILLNVYLKLTRDNSFFLTHHQNPFKN